MASTWKILKNAVLDFVNDDAMTQAAALAFYTALSFAPLLVIIISISGAVSDGAQEQVLAQIASLMGPEAAEAASMVIEASEDRPSAGTLAGIIGFATLLFSAAGVFAQLQYALNVIWNVQPKATEGVWGWLRRRLLSFGMVLAIGFVLLTSLVINAVLGFVLPGEEALWRIVNLAVSLLVFTGLFAVMFKYLPDVKIGWRQVLIGAGLTAVLFALGKFLIGLYVSKSAVGSAYGAAGTLVVFLVWMYYSALIFFFGAEMTQVIARETDHAIQPNEHAELRDAEKGEKATTKAEEQKAPPRHGGPRMAGA